jgi:hypothetical protein
MVVIRTDLICKSAGFGPHRIFLSFEFFIENLVLWLLSKNAPWQNPMAELPPYRGHFL